MKKLKLTEEENDEGEEEEDDEESPSCSLFSSLLSLHVSSFY